MRRRDPRSWRWRIGGVVAAGLFLAYLIALPPHLVHHLFDDDHDARVPCPHLAQSQHTPELQPELPGHSLLAPAGILSTPPSESAPPAVDLTAHFARAPPRFSPSV